MNITITGTLEEIIAFADRVRGRVQPEDTITSNGITLTVAQVQAARASKVDFGIIPAIKYVRSIGKTATGETVGLKQAKEFCERVL